MTDRRLNSCRILVVEDEYLLADDLAQELMEEGAEVVGPVPSVARAMSLLDAHARLDGAILDINLGGEPVFPVADLLIDRGVPVLFTTGYDAAALPSRLAHVPRCEKPVNIARVTAALGRVIHA